MTHNLISRNGFMKLRLYVIGWLRLSRVPFLSVGLFPLFLGFVLAWRWGYRGPIGLYLLTTVAAILIMWMTYYMGEWNDLEGDRINQDFNLFSGGSRILVEGVFPKWIAFLLGYGCLAGAIAIGLYIYLQYRTGPLTLLLGGIGIFAGFFYSSRPFQLAYRGLGEIFVGFSYGWLPIATGFYLLAGFFSPQAFLLSIPVGLSIFNVILINEFPDEEADRAIGKRNLVVRFGKEKMTDLYMGSSILIGLSFVKVLLIFGQTPLWLLAISGIPLFLILWNLLMVWREAYRESKSLELLCRNTLFINLSITLILTIQQTIFPSP
jgi:1,4-dihydroxy-2-naphthoate octaprenyltransferase